MAKTKEELEQSIKQGGLADASINAEYNRLTGNKSGAADFYNSLQNTSTQQNVNTNNGVVIPQNNNLGTNTAGATINTPNEVKTPIINEQVKTAENTPQTVKKTTIPEVKTTETTKINQNITPELQKALQGQEVIDLYKKRGSNMSDLENIVEAKYGTTAQQVNGGLEAVIDGVKYRWENNQYGDPVKKSLGRVDQPVIEQNEDVLFSNAIQGGVIDQNNPKYADVQKRVDKYNLFTRMSDKDIQNSLGNGLLLPGTTEYNDLMKNPEQAKRIKQAEQLNIINGKKADEQTLLQNKSDEILTNNKVNINGQAMTLSDAMNDGYISDTEYADMTSSPEIKAKMAETQKRKDEVAILQAKYDAIEDTIEAELKGQGAISKRAKEIMVMNEKKRQLGPLNLAITLANNSIGTLTQLEDKAAKLFTLNYDSYKDQKSAESKKLDLIEERKYNAEQQLASETRAFENQKELLKLQQEYKDKDIQTSIITDSATGKQILINNQTGEVIKTYNTGLTPSKVDNQSLIKMGEDALYDPNTKQWITPPGTTTGGSIDKQTATSKYGTTPAVRNFNPGNIMDTGFGGQKVEGERFTVFNSPQEGFNALVAKIENIQAGNSKVYSPNMTLLQYISKYAPASDNNNPTAYANSIAKDLGVTSSAKIGDLDPVKLASAHAKHEDRNSYQMLQDLGIINADGTAGNGQNPVNTALLSSYRGYVEDGKVPAKYVLEGLGITLDQFVNNASQGYDEYLKSKSKEISSEYPNLKVEFTNNYATNSASQREKLNESLTKIADVDRRISRLKELFTKHGTEVWPTDAKSEMQSLRQQITLKAKEIENLGVLNGPDMGLLESLLPKTTGFLSGLFSLDKNTLAKINSLQSGYRTDAKTKGINYGAKIIFSDNTETGTTTKGKLNEAEILKILQS